MKKPLGHRVPFCRAFAISTACVSLSFSMNHLPAIAQVASDTAPRQPAVFSGPQVGETLPPLVVRGVFEPVAGKEWDLIQDAGQGPLVLIFVHDINRLAISLTRVVSQYAHTRAGDGLASAVILLDDDPTTAEATLKRIRHALIDKVTHAVSVDGREGPGSFGLNRNVTLTILVAKDGTVTANHAIVQPSLQVDLPKILNDLVAVAGGPAPHLELLLGSGAIAAAGERMRPAGTQPLDMRPLLAPLIRKDATDEQVDEAAAVVEQRIHEEDAIMKEVARIATTIVNSDKLENYGTPRTRFYLKKWAQEFGAVNQNVTDKATRE